MSDDLKPCPFCGQSAKHEVWSLHNYHRVWCGNCDVEMDYFCSLEDAAMRWNTRAPQWLPIESLISEELVLTWHEFSSINQNKASPHYGKTGYCRIQQRFGGRLFPSEACETGFVSHWQPLQAPPEVV